MWVFDRLCVCVFFKARGGAAMALNVLGKFKVMWVGKFLESSRVWAGKVLGKFEGSGRAKFGGMWACKVLGSLRVCEHVGIESIDSLKSLNIARKARRQLNVF